MSELDLSGLVVVVAVAFSAPLVLGLAPALRLPSVVLEIVAGIAISPSGLGWVEVDQPIEVLALIGLAFLLSPAWRSTSRSSAGGRSGSRGSASPSRSASRSSWVSF